MNEVEKTVSQIHSLPTLPQIVQKVIEMVGNPNISSAKLAKTISLDAPLVSKILKVVNSAYYGLPRKISTLTQATVVLGFNAIKNIVLTTSVFTMFNKNGNHSRFDRKKFWEHSIGCATASKILSKKIHLCLPEEAFVAGLIHDIGKIVLDQFLHQDFEEILNLIQEKNISILAAEKEVLGVDHCQIGEWLCDKWNFPRQIQESVAYHHSPELATINRKIVTIVHLGNAISRSEGLGFSGDSQPVYINPVYLKFVNINKEELTDIKAEIHEEFEKSAIFLELLN